MKSFIENCCDQCWHSSENPCELFIACCLEGPLCHKNENCKDKFANLNNDLKYMTHDLPIIFIGMGTCGLASGAEKVKSVIEEELIKHNLKAAIVPTGCIGYCAKEPIVDIKLPGKDRISYCEVFPKDIPQLIETTIVKKSIYEKKLLGSFGQSDDKIKKISDVPFFKRQQKVVLENGGVINPNSIDEYIAAGGFRAIDKVLRLMNSVQVVVEIKESGLRGRGGGGFSTGTKWEMALKKEAEQKYIICNADEGDPGAFMDRSVLESDPYRIIEGMIIGGYAIGASHGYIYCRAEYPLAIQRLHNAIENCRRYGLLGKKILATEKILLKTFTAQIELLPDNALVIEAACTPVPHPDGSIAGVVIVLSNITQFKQIEQIKSQFVSMVAHELKTPLAAVQGFLSIMFDDEIQLSKEKEKEYLSRSVLRLNSLKDLVNDLLDISRMELKTKYREIKDIHLQEIIQNTVQLLKLETKKKNISIVTTIEKDLPSIKVDQNEITRIITNLLSNAIKYNKESGKIFVDALTKKIYVSIIIKDTGIGMKPEETAKLFNEFYRAKNEKTRGISGTGLGLTIVKRIVDSYHGKVEFESEFGNGTTFIIDLPINTN